MSFQAFLIERRRGVLLQALADATTGTQAAADLLHSYCLAVGLRCTRDEIVADLKWLGERHLVQTGERAGLMLAAITQRGREVVQRLASEPGVSMPDAP